MLRKSLLVLWNCPAVSDHLSFCFDGLVFVHSKVFFTDYGQIPKVERCDMDGQNRTKLVDSKIVFPHGITLDLVSRLVYWADAYLDYIEVVDYEGKNRHTIIQGLLVRCTEATFFSEENICPGVALVCCH